MPKLPTLLLLALLCTCAPPPESTDDGPRYDERVISLDPDRAADLSRKLREEANVQVDGDLELTLWANDSLVQDPIAISVAPDGRIFYTSATRQQNSEFDIRGHRNWMTASLAFESVEDRREFLRNTFSAGSEESERHLKDLNEDGQLDWRDLTVEKEQVWFVTDESRDGVADRAQLYLEDFHTEITDVANGIEYADGEVYISVGPDLWRTRDTDGDRIADETDTLSHGWIVHVGFSGHGMSGVTVGPQGRIWWGAGDVGMNVIDKEGNQHKYPHRGTVVRCEPDGSNFEVFAMGVRNTHEFAFDDYGNLISVDNDGDHAGESERLVYLIDGSDSGWRINWQFGKYTDPKNNDYKVWMDEGMYRPREEGQAAYFLPPIQNYVNGPTGLVYNPGTALGPEYYNHFFVAEFRGNPANSPIHAFTLEPEGAGFKLASTRRVVSGLLPTGVDFGADGAIYFGDWINGWEPKQGGRIWKLDVPGGADSPIRREVHRLLTSDFSAMTADSLQLLLGHQDQRVRKNAQFALVDLGDAGAERLLATARGGEEQLARVHALWGLSQLARAGTLDGDVFTPFLDDSDPEIIAQAARLIGDVRHAGAGDRLIALLEHDEPRVRFMALEALGRTENREATDAIVQLVETDDGRDNYLRHGAMIALGRGGDAGAMVELKDHPSRAVRTVAVVALRRMQSPRVAEFLNDKDEYIVAEAARAINDDYSIPDALPALAATLGDPRFTSEPLLRRAINANLRVGGEESLQRLIDYAAGTTGPAAMRAEALATLTHWGSPSLFDRVDGRYRGELDRDSVRAAELLTSNIADLIARGDAEVRIQAIRAAGQLGIAATGEQLATLLRRDRNPEVRLATLNALHQLDRADFDRDLEAALDDRDIRARALELLPTSDIPAESSVALYERVMRDGTTIEQQAALLGLSGLPGPAAAELLGKIYRELEDNRLDPAVRLDLTEAIAQHGDPELNRLLTDYEAGMEDSLGLLAFAGEGGDIRRGQRIFFRNESAQCVRCHAIFEYGGNVGPGLANIGNELSHRQLLEALIRPSARLAPGYETVLVTKTDGEMLSGVVLERTEENLKLSIGKEDILTLAAADIAGVESLPSSMPSMEEKLTPRQIRDVVAYLGSLREERDAR